MSISRLIRLILAVCLVFAASACSKKASDSIPDGADESVSTGMAMLSSSIGANDSSGTVAFRETQSPTQRLLAALEREFSPVHSAQATTTSCSSYAAADTCSSGSRSATYSSCPIGSTAATYSGTVILSYSTTPFCVQGVGDTVTRTVGLIRTNPVTGISVTTSSDSHADYRGTTVSGGARLTQTSTGYTLDILGMYKRAIRGSTTIFDVSTATTSPFVYTVSGTSKTLTSGTLEVAHNVAQYVATFSTTNLTYDSSTCCYPTSGTVNVSYSGSITGSGSVTFDSCGSATLTMGDSSKSVTLSGCE